MFDNQTPKRLMRPAAGDRPSQVPARTCDMPAIDVAAQDEAGGLIELGRTLYMRKGIMALAFLTGIVAGIAMTALQDTRYEAKAAIEVQGVNENFLNLHDIDPANANNYSPESYVQTQAEILRQDALLEQVARKLRIQDWPEFRPQPSRWNGVREFFGLKPAADGPAPNTVELAKTRLKIRSTSIRR